MGDQHFLGPHNCPRHGLEMDVPRELGPGARTPRGERAQKADQPGWARALSQTAPGLLGTDQSSGAGDTYFVIRTPSSLASEPDKSQPAPGKDKLLLAPPAALGPGRGRSGEEAVGPPKVRAVKVLLPSSDERAPEARTERRVPGRRRTGDAWRTTSLH